jgi:hypothetical protein
VKFNWFNQSEIKERKKEINNCKTKYIFGKYIYVTVRTGSSYILD